MQYGGGGGVRDRGSKEGRREGGVKCDAVWRGGGGGTERE